MQRVQKITGAFVLAVPGEEHYVAAIAEGKVGTSGWTSPQLGAWFYVVPPDDGLQDFDFIAQEPSGFVIQVETAISASLVIPRDASDYWGPGRPLLGIRVHAQNNTFTAEFEGQEVRAFRAVAPAGDTRPIPWPWSRGPGSESTFPWPTPYDIHRPGPESNGQS